MSLNLPNRNQTTTVIVDIAPAYEFIRSIHVYGDFDHCEGYEIGREWFDAISAKIPEHLADFLARSNEKIFNLIGLAYDCPAPKDVPTFLRYVEETDALELRLRFLGYYIRYVRRSTSPEIILKAAQGDKQAQKQFMKTSFPDNHVYQKALRTLLPLTAEETKSLLLELFYWWYNGVFREQETHIMAIVERDAETKRALQQTMSAERFIEVATNGFEYVAEPYIRQVVLMPSFVSRPYVDQIDHHDTEILSYSVADESLTEDVDAPPPRLLKLYKALSDERRLRILKKLAGGESYSLQEVADDLGLAKSTIHHHFIILRTAGLVRIRTNDSRYSLRQDKLPDLTELLEAYLKRGKT